MLDVCANAQSANGVLAAIKKSKSKVRFGETPKPTRESRVLPDPKSARRCAPLISDV
jgi:hypothetical protein